MAKEIIINPTPKVEVKKIKNGQATVISYDGEDYILRHRDQYKGPKKGLSNENQRNNSARTNQ